MYSPSFTSVSTAGRSKTFVLDLYSLIAQVYRAAAPEAEPFASSKSTRLRGIAISNTRRNSNEAYLNPIGMDQSQNPAPLPNFPIPGTP